MEISRVVSILILTLKERIIIYMFTRLTKKALICPVLFLIACTSSNNGPVTIRDAGESGQAPVRVTPVKPSGESDRRHVSTRDSQGHQNQSHQKQGAKPAPTVVQPAAAVRRDAADSPLKQQLLQNAKQQLADRNAKGAIIFAERGLRIDRKEPRFYEVLAAAYRMLGDKGQSEDFARQGLRYATPGSETYHNLQAWIP